MISVAELKEHMRTHFVSDDCESVSDAPKVDSETPISRAVPSSRHSVKASSECTIPVITSRGEDAFHDAKLFEFDTKDGLHIEVVAAVKGDVRGKADVPVRIHSECFTG